MNASAEQSWLHTVLLVCEPTCEPCVCGLKYFVVHPTMTQHRTYKDECSFIERLNENAFLIKKGFVPNMKVSQFPTQADLSPGAFLQKSFNEVKSIMCKNIRVFCIPQVFFFFSCQFVLWNFYFSSGNSMRQRFSFLCPPTPPFLFPNLLPHSLPTSFIHFYDNC